MGHMIEVFKRVKQKYVTASVPEISVNSSSITRGTTKLLNQTFTTTYRIYIEDRLIWGSRLVSGAGFYRYKWIRPPPVCGARRLPGARLLTEVLRYMYMKWIQDKGQKAALISTLQYNFSNFGAIAVQFWCILSYIRLLKQSKNFLGDGRLGGPRPPRPPSKYAPGLYVCMCMCVCTK